MPVVQTKKKSKKAGRNIKACVLYRDRKIREKNKISKILRHLKSHPASHCAVAALRRIHTETPSLIRRAIVNELSDACRNAAEVLGLRDEKRAKRENKRALARRTLSQA